MTGFSLFALGAAALVGTAPPAPLAGPGTPPAKAEVTAVSVVPSPGHAEIVIAIRGAADVRDFMLREPDRLVVDLLGATLPHPGAAYDGVARAGIRDVRYAQFRPDIVRIAIYLDGPRDYRIDRGPDAIRIRFGADDDSFRAWSSATPAALNPPTAAAPAPAPAAGDSDETTASAAPAPEVRLPPPPATHLVTASQQAPRITVSWDNADIADVVTGFAVFSGRTIILGKGITGTVTAEIKNQPWPEAFAAVLATQGLQAVELPGGIIRVDSPGALAALDSTEPLTTRMVPVNYVSAGQLVPSVKSVLSKRGTVVSDTTTNSLIITETRSRIGDVQDFVKNLDVRTPQVSIQSKIIFVDRTDIQALGLQYDLGADNGPFFNRLVQRTDPNTGDLFDPGTVVIGGQGVGAIANAQATVPTPALNVVFATAIGGFRFHTFLQALQQLSLADVQAEPVISTLDNREAQITVGEDVPVRIIDFGAVGGQGANQPKATVSFRSTGITLRVTPHVTNERQIFMQIYAERSNLRTLAAADLGFTIQKQNAQNQLLVEDGETAVIGGLTVTSVDKTRSGIPLLVDLPIIGKLFGFSNTQEERQDLIILVTPRIIDDGSK
jgi:type IV pilus assembly protein PilQ